MLSAVRLLPPCYSKGRQMMTSFAGKLRKRTSFLGGVRHLRDNEPWTPPFDVDDEDTHYYRDFGNVLKILCMDDYGLCWVPRNSRNECLCKEISSVVLAECIGYPRHSFVVSLAKRYPQLVLCMRGIWRGVHGSTICLIGARENIYGLNHAFMTSVLKDMHQFIYGIQETLVLQLRLLKFPTSTSYPVLNRR